VLLDTNVVSELRKLRPHGGVLAWFATQEPLSLAISSVTLFELQAGAERTRRHDVTKADELDRWITALPHQVKVMDFDESAARVTARLLIGRNVDLLPDAMIAGTAIGYDLPLATRNTRDFEGFPVQIVNPFLFR